MNSDSLLQSVEQLFDLLDERKIDYVLVGGIALLQYIEGRNTGDLDLLMALSSLEKLPEIKISSRDQDFARGKYGELQIDILLTRNPLFREVQKKHTTTQHFLERDITIATVDGLLILKLYALPSLYRQGDFARVALNENDIATLIHDYEPDINVLIDKLALFINESDTLEIKNILSEIRQRIERFRKG